MNDLRTLQFESLNQAADEATRLLQGGYIAHGNWSLGQICLHLRLVQDPSIDGYPKWMSLFAFLRPFMRRILLPKALSSNPPRGIRTMGTFQPGTEVEDRREVEQFVASVERFLRYPGAYYPHPAFGRLSRDQLEQVHAAHAAHHLRFLEPKANADGKIE
jgi:hypothetical protein